MTEAQHSDGTLQIKTHSILEDYDVQWNKKLGTGISGPVRPCQKRTTTEKFALKCLLDNPKSRTEINLHWMCSGHSNIVTVLDVYANDVQFPGEHSAKPRLLMVLEFMEGGELFDRISKETRFTEKKAARYLQQIARAVYRCHSLNVAHRDLKPENLLMKDNAEDSLVKLTDFGFAKIDDGNLQTPQFTPYYVAPQVLEAHNYQNKQKKGVIPTSKPYTYDKSCDMWSLGVILYIMLCGYPPFYSETPSRQITQKMRQKILSGQYEFPEDDWQNISDSAKQIVRGLLHVNPAYRLNIQELVNHPWMNDAPDVQLHSPAVFTDKMGMEDIKLAHSQHLTTMRIPEKSVKLKSVKDSNNPLIRKRKLTLSQSSLEEEMAPVSSRLRLQEEMNQRVKPLRDIIAHCLYPPKVDNEECALNDLVQKALSEPHIQKGLHDILLECHWNGTKFEKPLDKMKFAHDVSMLVQNCTESSNHHGDCSS